MRDKNGNILGKKLAKKDWCSCAMEGSCKVDDAVFNYSDKTYNYYVDCSAYFDHKPSGYVKFKKVDAPYGLGVKGWHLVPFKSIAVDSSYIPFGSKVYIPSAKRVIYELEGKSYIHDGIFLAHDTGGLIKGNHIDVFIGPVSGKASNFNPFSFIKSNSSGTFEAYILK